jgi:S-adenosylmethionine synthetase
MKVFVAGASGILGRDLCKILSDNNIDYTGSFNTRMTEKCVKIDFFNEELLEKELLSMNVDVVINCIVERFTDVCEKDWVKTMRVNVDIPDIISKVCARNKIYLIHISTDYVFDGKTPPYNISSCPNPLQNYGISKLIAEYRVKANGGNYLIIRVPVLYTNSYEYLDETAVTTLGKKVMNQVDTFTEDNVSIRRPIFIPDFCNFVLDAAKNKITGTRHFFNNCDKTTKYKMIKNIASYLRLPHDHITPINSFGPGCANRPIDTELLDTDNIFFKTDIREGIATCFEKFAYPEFASCPQEFLVLFDLDGTLIDSEKLHYEAYRKTLSPWADIKEEYFFDVINNGSIDDIFKVLNIPRELIAELRNYKQEIMESNATWIEGAKEFINYLDSIGVSMVIVTNTDKSIVDKFCKELPELAKIKNWVCRKDYSKAKPDPECYRYAVEKYGADKKYIIGFENTLNGFKALKQVTSRTYCITNKTSPFYSSLKKEDTIHIKNFNSFLGH